MGVTQHGCAVSFVYNGGRKSGVVNGYTLTVHGWSAPGTIKANGRVEFTDGGYWHQTCPAIDGAYFDNARHSFTVTQHGCTVSFVYKGQHKSGTLSGRTLTVIGWSAPATVQLNGRVQFTDGGYWQK